MILFHCCAPLQSPRTHTCEYLGSFQILGVRKWVDVFQYKNVKCPSFVLVPRGGCLSLGRTAPTRFHTVWDLALCAFQKSGMKIAPCLRFLTAAELLIKRLMIKLWKGDSWAELLPVSDRGHDLPSQSRKPPPAESRPCLDPVPGLLEGALVYCQAATAL